MIIPGDADTRRDIHDAVLDAAERLLARFGYRKMTMDDLAREAGLGRRTLYLHFRGKEEIALASIDRVVARLLAGLSAIAGEERPPAERVRRMLVARILLRFDAVQEYYQSFDEMFAALRPAYLARRERYFAEEAQALAAVLDEGMREGTFRPLEPVMTARAMLLATNALLPYSLSARELGAREEVEANAERIAGLLLDGLRACRE